MSTSTEVRACIEVYGARRSTPSSANEDENPLGHPTLPSQGALTHTPESTEVNAPRPFANDADSTNRVCIAAQTAPPPPPPQSDREQEREKRKRREERERESDGRAGLQAGDEDAGVEDNGQDDGSCGTALR